MSKPRHIIATPSYDRDVALTVQTRSTWSSDTGCRIVVSFPTGQVDVPLSADQAMQVATEILTCVQETQTAQDEKQREREIEQRERELERLKEEIAERQRAEADAEAQASVESID